MWLDGHTAEPHDASGCPSGACARPPRPAPTCSRSAARTRCRASRTRAKSTGNDQLKVRDIAELLDEALGGVEAVAPEAVA